MPAPTPDQIEALAVRMRLLIEQDRDPVGNIAVEDHEMLAQLHIHNRMAANVLLAQLRDNAQQRGWPQHRSSGITFRAYVEGALDYRRQIEATERATNIVRMAQARQARDTHRGRRADRRDGGPMDWAPSVDLAELTEAEDALALGGTAGQEPGYWPTYFKTTNRGAVIHDEPLNLRLAFLEMGISVKWNTFSRQAETFVPPEIVREAGIANTRKGDVLVSAVYVKLRERFGFKPDIGFFRQWLDTLALDRTYHPILDELSALTWDDEPRLETWLLRCAGAQDTPLNRHVGKLMFIAPIRRLKNPGEKHDLLVVLEGPQGAGKSKLLRLMARRDEWFTDALPLGVDDKTVIERLRGKWIVEFAELKGLEGREAELIKSFLSRQSDLAREAYAHKATEVPRAWTGYGTTNRGKWLSDETGNRRLLPVEITAIDLEWFKANRDQLWAEAIRIEPAFGSLDLPRHLWVGAGIEQEARRQATPWEDLIIEATARADISAGYAANNEWLAALAVPNEQRQNNNNFKKLSQAMQGAGWDSYRWTEGGVPKRGYKRGEVQEGRTPRLWPQFRGHGLVIRILSDAEHAKLARDGWLDDPSTDGNDQTPF